MFRFPLQSVLDVKIMQEDMAQSQFARQLEALAKEREDLLAIQQQKKQLIDTLRDTRGKRISLPEFLLDTTGVKQCLKGEEMQQTRVQRAAAESDRQREALLEAAQKRKAMEIMKTKMQQKHHVAAEQLERAAVDEMASVRHQRRERD
jgi:flagellar export protein FliJ